jgi:hypothetical protein
VQFWVILTHIILLYTLKVLKIAGYMRKKLKAQHGTLDRYLDDYLYEFMLRKEFGKFRCLNELIKITKHQIERTNNFGYC